MKLLLNNRGITIVEALAVITISSIVIVLSTSIIVQTFKNQKNISIESQLRDEADVISSSLMKDLFTLKESEIDHVACGIRQGGVDTDLSCKTLTSDLSGEDLTQANNTKQKMLQCQNTTGCTPYALIYLTNGSKIGFEGDTVYTRVSSYKIATKNVKLSPYYTIERVMRNSSSNQYSYIYSFTLNHTNKNKDVTFTNEIMSINDL